MKRIIALFLILSTTLLVLCSCSSAPESSVMKVGETEISAQEYNYTYYAQVQSFYSNYADYLSYFGLDPEKPLKEQACTVTDKEQTWADYFMEQTEEILKQIFTFYNAAKAEGMELSEDSLLQIDAFVLSAEEAAESAKMTLDEYLSEYYGKGLTGESYREFLSRRILATQYCDEKLGAIIYSDEDYEKYYQENRSAIDKADFRVYTLTEDFLPADSEASTEDEVNAAVKALAEAFADGLTSEKIFLDRALSYAPEDQKETYQSDSSTLAVNIVASDLANTEMSAWLFDTKRVAGDVSVFQTTTGAYTVCYFLALQRDERPLASMRHILLNVTQNKDGTSDADAVHQEIKDIYAQWEEAGFTEESFISLAEANTDDPGSKENGGLYEAFSYGTMVSEINDWIYADGRKTDDSSIIKTSYGYHLVWFTGYGEIAWKSECLPGLQDADYYELLESLEEANPVTFSENHRDSLGNDY
ncbi:MAG: peptidylprolyl isomerase [Clostridia bacterium]|nr:peptidylprolyl isomerase [Clostridia bacterium]